MAISSSSARKKPPIKADVLVVGGGLAGGVMAIALALGGLDVVVVDREDPKVAIKDAFDGRASAIALASQKVFHALGLWEAMKERSAPILEIRVTDGESPFFLHYDYQDTGDEPLGYMVENQINRKAIFKRIGELDNILYLAPASVAEIERGPEGVSAVLSDGRKVSASLVVGADGRRSQMREAAGIRLTTLPYHQTGIVCTVAHEHPHDFIAHEHFLAAGPFAILPLMDNRSSIVWTERDDLVDSIMALDDAGFHEELSRRFGDFLGKTKVVGPRFSYPFTLQYAESATAERLALVADAYHGMHPVAGQGLNMGLRDVAALAEVVVEAHDLGMDIGSSGVLERYQRWRRFDNALMLGLTDMLVRLFSNDVLPLRLARDVGMAVVDKIPPLKKVFMRHAMGLVGDLPRLMRGESIR
jgi:2-octaprenyl-6-methoxyphenol hydroxylase